MPDTRDGEFDLIERYFKPLSATTEGAFGLTDDAGQLVAKENQEHVVTCDALVQGVHFLPDTSPADIGYKALAVNVSDLCAKGAEPACYLLALALAEDLEKEPWLEAFTGGLKLAQGEYGCGLLGGDTVATPGPAVISITAIGTLPKGSMVHRAGASVDDLVYVTGTIGDATLGLESLRNPDAAMAIGLEAHKVLVSRHLHPSARIAAVPLVREFASAAMDVSDGLIGDFVKLARASGLGGTLNAPDVPLSKEAQAWLSKEPGKLEALLTGGDDYELLITLPSGDRKDFEAAAQEQGVQIACIGRMTAPGSTVVVLDGNGAPMNLPMTGYQHF